MVGVARRFGRCLGGVWVEGLLSLFFFSGAFFLVIISLDPVANFDFSPPHPLSCSGRATF